MFCSVEVPATGFLPHFSSLSPWFHASSSPLLCLHLLFSPSLRDPFSLSNEWLYHKTQQPFGRKELQEVTRSKPIVSDSIAPEKPIGDC